MAMRKKISAMIVTAAAALFAASLLAPNALAHHGWGADKEDIEITRTRTEWKRGNPQDRRIATDADGGHITSISVGEEL